MSPIEWILGISGAMGILYAASAGTASALVDWIRRRYPELHGDLTRRRPRALLALAALAGTSWFWALLWTRSFFTTRAAGSPDDDTDGPDTERVRAAAGGDPACRAATLVAATAVALPLCGISIALWTIPDADVIGAFVNAMVLGPLVGYPAFRLLARR